MKDADFARRLAQACDQHEMIPAYGYGRQTWLKEKMRVSHEAVRKWVKGESRPRPRKMKELAELLGVDEAWLSLGVEPEGTPKEKKERSAKLTGASNVFLGLLQAAGGSVAFPDQPDSPIDFFAILNGRHLAFHVTLAHKVSAETVAFRVPVDFETVTTVGAVRGGPVHLDFVVLPRAVIKQHGVHHGGHIELAVEPRTSHYVVNGHKLPKLQSFDEITDM